MKTGDQVDQVLDRIKALDKERQAAVDQLMALQGNPREINARDSKALAENMEALRTGAAIAVFPDEKKRSLKPWEVDKNDPAAINAAMADIARGRKLVVDPMAPEPVLTADQVAILTGA